MGSIRLVMGRWFVYGRTRVLGPFVHRGDAERAMLAEGEE